MIKSCVIIREESKFNNNTHFLKVLLGVVGILVALFLFNGTTHANENNSSFQNENPWENNFRGIDKSTVIFDEQNLLYDEKAEEVFERMKYENEQAKKDYPRMSEADREYMETAEKLYNLNNSMGITPMNFSKAWYRTEFTALALAMAHYGAPRAGNFLGHSLQDYPSSRSYPAGSSLSNDFTWTPIYTEISIPMAQAIDIAESQGRHFVADSDSDATSIGNAGLDFYLTFGKFNYEWSAGRNSSNGSWDVYINLNDRYDYERSKSIPSSFPHNFIQLVVNHAADAQAAGAIVPYMTNVYFQQNYTP